MSNGVLPDPREVTIVRFVNDLALIVFAKDNEDIRGNRRQAVEAKRCEGNAKIW